MRILSFDIGVYNLAYAVLDTDLFADEQDRGPKTSIVEWEIISLKERGETSNLTEITRTLIDVLDDKFGGNAPISMVLIENQPCMKNPVMKSIQMIIYSFFMIQSHYDRKNGDGEDSIQVKLVSASNKLKVKHKVDTSHIVTKDKYKKNKLVSVEYAKNYLNLGGEVNADWVPKLEKTKKADDLSDCYLQAIHYIENN